MSGHMAMCQFTCTRPDLHTPVFGASNAPIVRVRGNVSLPTHSPTCTHHYIGAVWDLLSGYMVKCQFRSML